MKKCLIQVDQYAANPSSELSQDVQSAMSAAYKKIDKAVAHGIFHANNGARKKSRLARAFKRAVPASAS